MQCTPETDITLWPKSLRQGVGYDRDALHLAQILPAIRIGVVEDPSPPMNKSVVGH